jgi:hypothetical protein
MGAKIDYEKARQTAVVVAEIANTGIVPTAEKERAEARLLGAMLREPFMLHEVVGSLNSIALSHAGNGIAPAFAAILKQFTENGKYSVTTIQAATGIQVGEFAEIDTDLDLAWAVEHWWDEYTRWGESSALLSGLVAKPDGMQAMREKMDRTREALGLVEATNRGDGAREFLEWVTAKIDGKEPECLTVPHIQSLRSIVRRFEPTDLVVIAGRPGMGKTQAALNLHDFFATSGVPGVFVSLEMSSIQLYARWLGVRHGVNPNTDWSILPEGITEGASNIFNAGQTNPVIDNISDIADLEAMATAMHFKGKIKYLIVDYLQLMTDATKSGNRETEVASLSRRLKRLAKRLSIPVFALAQLSRAVESRGGSKRPNLSDLRESGAIEQDANTVIFLYRPEYYDILEDESGKSLKGVGEFIIAKQRSGSTGAVLASWHPILGYRDLPEEAPAPFTPKPPMFQTPFPAPDTFIEPMARPDLDEPIPF